MATTDTQRLWVVGGLLIGGWLLWLLSPILTPFVVSALLAYLGDPLVDRLERMRLGRTAAVSVVFFVIFVLLLVLVLLLVPRMESQITQLLQRLPAYLTWMQEHLLPRLQAWLPDDFGGLDLGVLQQTMAKHWRDAGGVLAQVWKSISGSGLALLGWIANLVLVPVLTFYLLRDWDRMVAGIQILLPRRSAPTLVRLASEADQVLGAFLRGQLSVMFALGVIYTTGLWLVGLDLALLIGMLAGIVSFVPYLGLVVGIVVAGLAAVLQFQGWEPLPWVVLVFVVGQVIEGSVLTPRLVGGQIGLHPVAVIFAVMAGGQLYGFFGILLALPVAAVGMVLVRHVLQNYRASPLYTDPDPKDPESSDKQP
jgi:predicted PurR-regulated permease PerM